MDAKNYKAVDRIVTKIDGEFYMSDSILYIFPIKAYTNINIGQLFRFTAFELDQQYWYGEGEDEHLIDTIIYADYIDSDANQHAQDIDYAYRLIDTCLDLPDRKITNIRVLDTIDFEAKMNFKTGEIYFLDTKAGTKKQPHIRPMIQWNKPKLCLFGVGILTALFTIIYWIYTMVSLYTASDYNSMIASTAFMISIICANIWYTYYILTET